MTNSWKSELKNLITDVEELWQLLGLPEEHLAEAKKAAALFPLRVPSSFLARMQKGNLHDPLLKQYLPWHLELAKQPEAYKPDALEEKQATKVPGLLHKYHGRVLLIATGTCAINCRYCFRRHFPYEENNPGSLGLAKIIDYIKNDASIFEVILSGGDPLMMSDSALKNLLEHLDKIPHLKTLRIHSRLPIVLPSRITPEFLAITRQTRLKKIMVIHANHAQELADEVLSALKLLQQDNWLLLNQAVLLKGINDTRDALITLQHKLFEGGVLPYYLHLLDKVTGTAHFEVSLQEAEQLLEALMQELPGYMVPKLVSEYPNLAHKWVHTLKL